MVFFLNASIRIFKRLAFIAVCQVAWLIATGQEISELTSGRPVSIRGLSVVDDKVIWVSASAGTVGKSTDGGRTWKWITVTGFEKRDFRDIEAFDAATAIIMAIAEPAQILKTADGGETWKLLYENKQPGMFLDAMEFWNPQSGIVLGDPVNGKFFIARTFDEGRTWREIDPSHLPAAAKGEACFASSGTNIRSLDRDEACFISGGTQSRYFVRDVSYQIPFVKGSETMGANSIAVRNNKKRTGKHYVIVVGGDFRNDTSRVSNCFISQDDGKTWKAPHTAPWGYRSCVEFLSKDKVLCVGTSGVDFSDDAGLNWRNISTEGFHVCRKAKNGSSVILAGSKGRIFKFEMNKK